MGVLNSQATGRSYQLVAELARGGFGQVFVAREVGPKASGKGYVAIKTLLPEVAKDEAMLKRFLDEARISNQLEHPNVARALDFGVGGDRPFLVFELLAGADLDLCLKADYAQQHQVPVEVACYAIAQAARGLHHAHTLQQDGQDLQVVHRDLSPSNLFLCAAGQVKVLDFGAALGRDRFVRTATGMVIGKVPYMAPEQLIGSAMDARTDVFALGLCLFEALTLQGPYSGLTGEALITRVYDARVPDVDSLRPGLPRGVVAALARATAAGPENRFATALALAEALEAEARRLTDTSAKELLASFYQSSVGPERLVARDARLAELAGTVGLDAEGPFAWEAPALSRDQGDGGPKTETEDLEVKTKDILRPERSTIREAPAVVDAPATAVDKRPEFPVLHPSTQLSEAPGPKVVATASAPRPTWQRKALFGALMVALLLVGMGLGQLFMRK